MKTPPRHELHSWQLTPIQAKELQSSLAKKISIRAAPPLRTIRTIAGADLCLDPDGHHAFAAAALFSFPDLRLLEQVSVRGPLRFPYVPGLLSFREAPLLLKALSGLSRTPDAVMLDGQGLAHPRRFGLACHVGLWLGSPSLGCAKSLLVGECRKPASRKGSRTELTFRGRRVGTALRTKDGCNPIYVSPGHHMDFETAERLALACCDGYRVPKPTRTADRLAAEAKRRFLALNQSPDRSSKARA